MPMQFVMLGQLLDGRYKIVQTVEANRYSQICIAEDTTQPDIPQCIVKCFRPGSSDRLSLEKARGLFHAEARKLQLLGAQSEQIPRLLAYFEQDREFYLVEERIDGQSLSDEIAQGQTFHEVDVMELLVDVLTTLKLLHSQEVIHGDINPKNLIRRQRDRKFGLVNFGAMQRISTPLEYDQTISTIGTPSYMPPEQAQGHLHPNCDVYALGLTAIHALTGKHPSSLGYNSKTGTLIWRNKTNISTEFELILDQAINQDFNTRYQSAEAMLQELSVIMQPLGPTQVQVTSKSRQRRLLITIFLGLIAGITTVMAVLSLKQYLPDFSRLRSPLVSPALLPPQESTTSKLPVSATSPATAIQPFKLQSTLTGHTGWVRALAFFANGHSFTSGSYDRTVRLWDIKNTSAFTILSAHSGFASAVNAIATNPDGHTFATGNLDKTVKLWDLRSGRPTKQLKGHRDQVFSLAFDPTGTMLASASGDKMVKLWNWRTGVQLFNYRGHKDLVLAVAISPNGRVIASGSKDKTIKLWDAKTGKGLVTFNGHRGAVRSLAFSPNGKILASSCQDGKIKLWDLDTGKEIHTFTGHTQTVTSIAFNFDGKWLASGSFDKTIKLWDVHTGQELQTLTGHEAVVLAVSFSPKNNTLISGSVDRAVKIWQQ